LLAQQRALLLGTFLGNEAVGYVNSVVGAAAGQPEYTYGKRHLLPFGEFVPPGFRWFVDLMQIPLGDQARGRSEAPFRVAGQAVRPLICYENLFGEDMVASVGTGPEAATVLVNVSNLAWFGERLVQDQDLQFSRLRALEFQRPVARATNTGSTALVDHTGRVAARLPALTRATLEVPVQGRRGATPYARWLAAAGLWPLWALAAVAVLGAGGRRERGAPRRRPAGRPWPAPRGCQSWMTSALSPSQPVVTGACMRPSTRTVFAPATSRTGMVIDGRTQPSLPAALSGEQKASAVPTVGAWTTPFTSMSRCTQPSLVSAPLSAEHSAE
jgi:hypothetical protein